MVDYNFIKRCKNYNIKNSKGFKYETIFKRSMNKINKIDKKINNKRIYYNRSFNYSNLKLKLYRDYIHNKISKNEYNEKKILLKHFPKSYEEYYKNLIDEKEQEKFKMCIHKLKLSLPDHLIYEIGTYFFIFIISEKIIILLLYIFEFLLIFSICIYL